jgi:hypothetical protein
MLLLKPMRFIKKNISEIFFRVILMAFLIVAPVVSFAQLTVIPCETSGRICNPIKTNNINEFIKTILEGVLKIGMPIIALAIIYCGFLFVAARGNSEKLSTAKDALLYTLVGAAILLGSWAIAALISNTVLTL